MNVEPLGIKIIWGDLHAKILTKNFSFSIFSLKDLLSFTFVVVVEVVVEVVVDIVVVDIVVVDVEVEVEVEVEVVDVVGIGPK